MYGAHGPRQIVIAGGGVAAVEALLALRALLAVGVELHLVAPNRRFVYQPLAVAAPFGLAETHLFELAELCEEHGARLHEGALEGVDAEARTVSLSDGEQLPYDALLVAVGAARRDWLEGAVHFGGAGEVEAFKRVLERLVAGSAQRLCLVNAPGVDWTLPLYELALLTASHMADAGAIGVELTVATHEAEPLAVFGPAAGAMLRNLLADRGIALRTGVQAQRLEHGELRFDAGAPLAVEEVVALSRLEGRAVPGLPCDEAGFVPVDEHSRVAALKGVYAAGDGTTFPIKQGGIAAQQADAAAEAIAAQLGDAIEPAPLRPMLRGMLLTGIAPAFLRAELGGATATAGVETAAGAPQGASFETAANPLWWPPGKVAGRYLAPYLAGHDPFARERTLTDLPASTRDPARARRIHDEARELALAFADRDGEDGHLHSAVEWLEVVERLDGVLPPGYLQKREEWRRRLSRS